MLIYIDIWTVLTWRFDFDRRSRNPTSCDHRSCETDLSIQPSLYGRNNSTAQQSQTIKMYLKISIKCPLYIQDLLKIYQDDKTRRGFREGGSRSVREPWWEAGQSGPSGRPNTAPCCCAGSSWTGPACSLNLETLRIDTENTHIHSMVIETRVLPEHTNILNEWYGLIMVCI